MLVIDEQRALGLRAAAVADLVRTLGTPPTRLSEDQLDAVVLAVAMRPMLYQDLVVSDAEHRWWMQLHLAQNLDVRVLSWAPDQASDWHDHGGSSGAFAVTSGALLEQSRADDGVSVRTRRLAVGQHGSFGPAHVHDVQHAAGSPAVSIHAYSPPLTGLTYYQRSALGFVAQAVVPEERRDAFAPSPY